MKWAVTFSMHTARPCIESPCCFDAYFYFLMHLWLRLHFWDSLVTWSSWENFIRYLADHKASQVPAPIEAIPKTALIVSQVSIGIMTVNNYKKSSSFSVQLIFITCKNASWWNKVIYDHFKSDYHKFIRNHRLNHNHQWIPQKMNFMSLNKRYPDTQQ